MTDTLRGISLMLCDEKAEGEVINIGSPNELEILNSANIITRITESNSNIAFYPLPENDPRGRCPDIGKAKRILGWEPVVEVEEGIRRTVEWFRLRIRKKAIKLL